MVSTIADSGTAVAGLTETSTQRTESASDSPRQGTQKAHFHLRDNRYGNP